MEEFFNSDCKLQEAYLSVSLWTVIQRVFKSCIDWYCLIFSWILAIFLAILKYILEFILEATEEHPIYNFQPKQQSSVATQSEAISERHLADSATDTPEAETSSSGAHETDHPGVSTDAPEADISITKTGAPDTGLLGPESGFSIQAKDSSSAETSENLVSVPASTILKSIFASSEKQISPKSKTLPPVKHTSTSERRIQDARQLKRDSSPKSLSTNPRESVLKRSKDNLN